MQKLNFIILVLVALLSACEIKLKPNDDGSDEGRTVSVRRYDRLESRYLTTGDFSALQQMNIDYPKETRTLVEDVLRIGEVNDPEINSKFLHFYQDTVLQSIIAEVELQYANMSDIDKQFKTAFERLKKLVPGVKVPSVYSQIGALDQSIVIGDSSIGISLDKYLGADYTLYRKYYSEQQRKVMERAYIVPDAMSFYVLSLFPLKEHDLAFQEKRDEHMGKVMWVVNRLMGKEVYDTKFTAKVAAFMNKNPRMPITELLRPSTTL